MRTRICLWVFLATALTPLGVAADDDDSTSSPRARAIIRSCEATPRFLGRAFLSERASREAVKIVDIAIFVNAPSTVLAPGKHAVHIHAVGSCTPCAAAGSHLDQGPFGHNTPVEANHPYHSGDLPNLVMSTSGSGSLQTSTSRVALTGPLSILDADGSAFIIHMAPDTYCPDPTAVGCAGGGRAACGIITREN
jgi:superoxide dismutase, Cu-Zn family